MRYVTVLLVGLMFTYAMGAVGAGLALVGLVICWLGKPFEPGELNEMQRKGDQAIKERHARVDDLVRRAIEANRSKSRS